MSGDDDSGFLRRWSKRKRSAERAAPEAEAVPEDAQAPQPTDAEEPVDPEEQQRLIDSLPDIESLTDQSDLSAFMQKGVPDELRNRALRRMWRSNPIYACVDGLNDYDLDYTDAAMCVENLKTAYKVGKGYIFDEAPPSEVAPEIASPQDGGDVEDAEPTPLAAADDADGAEDEDGTEEGGTEEDDTESPTATNPDTATKAGSPVSAGSSAGSRARRAARRRWGPFLTETS